MKQFDEEFSRKAKKAFESYDADHLAGDGWNAFTEKYGRKRSRVLWMPLWGKAASIIILVTAGVLLLNRTDQRKENEPADMIAQQGPGEKKDTVIIKEDISATIPAIKIPRQTAGVTVSKTANSLQSGRENGGEQAGNIVAVAVVSLESELVNTARSDTGVLLAANPREKRLTDDADASLNLEPVKALKDYFDLPRERMKTSVMTGFSGMMASIDNSRSTSQGMSIGFYVERQLSRRISIRPGLAMAKHSYGIESTPGGSVAFDYAAPELNGMSGTTTSFEADMEVISMEVPVNFVFSLVKRGESDFYITTGASTVFYLSQHLSGNFNNTYSKANVNSTTGQTTYNSMTTTVKVESKQELLNRVDFLGLANFSAGYSMPFGRGTHVSFEPFVQLPIKDLTSMNLRIRYGGLSMRVKF